MLLYICVPPQAVTLMPCAKLPNIKNYYAAMMDSEIVSSVIYPLRRNDNMLTISLRADQETQMGVISDVQNQLRDASALKVNYSAKHK